MDEIKEAFSKVKKEIEFLKSENNSISKNFQESKQKMIDLCDIISNLSSKLNFLEESNKELKDLVKGGNNSSDIKKEEILQTRSNYIINDFNKIHLSKEFQNIPLNKDLEKNRNFDTNTIQKESDNYLDIQTENKAEETKKTPSRANPSTLNQEIKSIKDQNQPISIGNQGVQTDRQTDNKTDRQAENSFDSALNALNSLDNLKKEIRLKFKKLTAKELLVFTTIYQLEEEYGYSDYKSLSNKLNLSESSIRDYISRLISKEIPIEKSKINNKEVQLSISSSLKKITSLNTILKLLDI